MIKKYWKLIALTAFIFSTITIMLLSHAKLSESFPNFSLQTLEGEEDYAASFLIDGSLNFSMMDSESFLVDEEHGTHYLYDEPYLERLEGFYPSSKFEQKKEDYRSFMRGKSQDDVYYYEDEDYLAYVNTSNTFFSLDYLDFNIDILDKETNDRIHTKMPIPNKGDFWHIDVAAVKVINDELIFILKNDENESIGLYRYTFDLQTEEITDYEEIYTTEDIGDDGYKNVEIVFNDNVPNKEMMIYEEQVLYIDEVNDDIADEVDRNITEKQVVNNIETYDITTDERTKIELPEDTYTPFAYDDEAIYYSETKDNQPVLKKYDRQQDKIVDEVTVHVEVPTEEDIVTQKIIKDGRLYLATLSYEAFDTPYIAVIDLASMHVDYVGEVLLEDDVNQDLDHMTEFYFNGFELKNS